MKKYKAYILKDGDRQIIIIPEAGGIFGKEGFCELNQAIINNLIKNSSQSLTLTENKVQALKKRSGHRQKMIELFNDFTTDVFDDNSAN